MLLELVGKQGALMGGKGGSMHLTSVEHGAMGSYAIVGAHLPIAVGRGLVRPVPRDSGQVAVCFFGDGTTNIGAFHEALNLAVVWKAPVVFVCENNQYMEYTAIGSVTAVERPAADRAAAYGLEPLVVDGNDVEAVYAMARRTIDRARAGEGPSLVEAITYRHGGHSRADPGTYRPEEEVKVLAGARPDPGAARAPGGGRRRRHRPGSAGGGGRSCRSTPPRRPRGMRPTRIRPAAMTQLWADGGSEWRS